MWFIVRIDLFVDGVVVGIGTTLDLLTGLVMALSMALSMGPLAFVAIAAAERQGMLAGHWRLLGETFVAGLTAGALLGCLVLQHRPLEMGMVRAAPAMGFLIMTMGQGITPEANREGKPGFAGVLYIGGPSLYSQTSPALKQRQ
jgi:zinc transporter, ZIP family